MSSDTPLVRTENLTKHFSQSSFLGRFLGTNPPVQAVSDVNFEIEEGEVLGVVGESGCGKSTLGRTILRLHEPTRGTMYFDGTDINSLSGKEMKEYRKEMQIIFQDVSSSLNPRMTAGEIVSEPMRIHDMFDEKEKYKARAIELLEQVNLSEDSYDKYPHQFSGGQKQRIMIGRALSTDPEFLVADEPVSALDVSVQAQVLNILKELQRDLGLTVLFVGHDISVVQFISDRIAVMYLGEIVEIGDADRIINDPHHPYTQALLDSKPHIGKRLTGDGLQGEVPSPSDPPDGCSFHTRCPYETEQCQIDPPDLEQVQPDQHVACYHYESAVEDYRS